MRDASRAGGAEVDLAGIRLGVGDQLGEAPHRERWIHHHDLGDLHHRGDEREILVRVEGHLGKHERRHRHGSLVVEPQRVAVGRGLGHCVDTEHASHAALVLDDDRLAESDAQGLREGPPENIRRASGWKPHDQAHGLGGIDLRKAGAGQQALDRGKSECGDRIPHRVFSLATVVAARPSIQ